MARPAKVKVDYFPHVTHTGKTIAILEARWGNDGYAFWFKLLELLGDSDEFSFNCNQPESWEYMLSRSHVTEAAATAILDKLSEIGAIDADLWARKVIWSDNFVNNLEPVFERRKTEAPRKPAARKNKTTINSLEESFGANNPEKNDAPDGFCANNSEKSAVIPTETDKVKESKVEETKGKEGDEHRVRECVREASSPLENESVEKQNKSSDSTTGIDWAEPTGGKRRKKKTEHPCPSLLRSGVEKLADTVYLKPEEMERLCLDYGEAGAKRIIELLDGYKSNNLNKCAEYRDDYKVITSWVMPRYLEECARMKKPDQNTSRSPSYAMRELENMAKKAMDDDEN